MNRPYIDSFSYSFYTFNEYKERKNNGRGQDMISFFGDGFDSDTIQNVQVSIFRNMIAKNEFSHLHGNILIISDRLYKLADELSTYIEDNTNARVLGVLNVTNNIDFVLSSKVDYLLIVGYLEVKRNYQIVQNLRTNNPKIKTVQWALLDDYIDTVAEEYNIRFKFDRIHSPKDFMNYLIAIEDLHD